MGKSRANLPMHEATRSDSWNENGREEATTCCSRSNVAGSSFLCSLASTLPCPRAVCKDPSAHIPARVVLLFRSQTFPSPIELSISPKFNEKLFYDTKLILESCTLQWWRKKLRFRINIREKTRVKGNSRRYGISLLHTEPSNSLSLSFSGTVTRSLASRVSWPPLSYLPVQRPHLLVSTQTNKFKKFINIFNFF